MSVSIDQLFVDTSIVVVVVVVFVFVVCYFGRRERLSVWLFVCVCVCVACVCVGAFCRAKQQQQKRAVKYHGKQGKVESINFEIRRCMGRPASSGGDPNSKLGENRVIVTVRKIGFPLFRYVPVTVYQY